MRWLLRLRHWLELEWRSLMVIVSLVVVLTMMTAIVYLCYLQFHYEILLHISTALMVAIVLLISVEVYTSYSLRREFKEYSRELAAVVWRAVFKRHFPETLVSELESIARQNAVRRDMRYVIRLKAPYDGLPAGRLVVERFVQYRVEKIVGDTVVVPVRLVIVSEFEDCDVVLPSGVAAVLPRHVCLKLNGVDQPITASGGLLKADGAGRLRTIEINRELTNEQPDLHVEAIAEEVFLTRDKASYIHMAPVDGLTIQVENFDPSHIEIIDVRLYHPRGGELESHGQGFYRFKGALLPGQGFAVSWREI